MTVLTLNRTFCGLALIGLGTIVPLPVLALSIAPPFSTSYSVTSLGSIPQLPTPYVGLTFLPGNPNTLLIGTGGGSSSSNEILSIGVTRDSNNQITGFTGTPVLFATINDPSGGNIDAGLTVGPNNVLFYTTWPDDTIGQIEPGSTSTSTSIDALTSLGFQIGGGGVTFVPAGLPGAGEMKITSYTNDTFYSTTVTPDGTGAFNIAPPTSPGIVLGIPGGATDYGTDSFVYVAAGNPQFTTASLLMAENNSGDVVAYSVDANGNPIPASRQVFLTGIDGVIGSTVDPLTGDFLFSTYSGNGFNPGGTDQIVEVSAETAPTDPYLVPESNPNLGLILLGGFGLGRIILKKTNRK